MRFLQLRFSTTKERRVRLSGLRLIMQPRNRRRCAVDHVYERVPAPDDKLFSAACGWPLGVKAVEACELAQMVRLGRLLSRQWRLFLSHTDTAFLSRRQRMAQLLLYSEELSREDQIDQSDAAQLRALAKARDFEAADEWLIESVRRHSQARKDALSAAKASETEVKLQRWLDDHETASLKWKFEWDAQQVRDYAQLRLQMSETIGLVEVHEWIMHRIYDAAERALVGEKEDRRHVLLVGPLGCGKKTGASLIVRAMRLLHGSATAKAEPQQGRGGGKGGKKGKGARGGSKPQRPVVTYKQVCAHVYACICARL